MYINKWYHIGTTKRFMDSKTQRMWAALVLGILLIIEPVVAFDILEQGENWAGNLTELPNSFLNDSSGGGFVNNIYGAQAYAQNSLGHYLGAFGAAIVFWVLTFLLFAYLIGGLIGGLTFSIIAWGVFAFFGLPHIGIATFVGFIGGFILGMVFHVGQRFKDRTKMMLRWIIPPLIAFVVVLVVLGF